MTLSRSLHLEPYRDPSGLGFALITEYTGSRPPCRQRTIVAVGWNFTEDRALFVNGAGLVVPSWHNRDALAPLLRRHTVRQAFGRVIGDGQFALKPAELKALEGSGRLKPWLVHYLPQPAGYLDDADPWTAYVAADLEAERDAFARNHAAAVELGQRCRAGVELPWSAAPVAGGADYNAMLHEQLEQHRADLEAWRREELAKGAQIAAYLRGDVGDPPLLALMKGAA
ncbi:TPA: hypothetical protein ACLF26_005044 [Pseudomonas aeruginosa]